MYGMLLCPLFCQQEMSPLDMYAESEGLLRKEEQMGRGALEWEGLWSPGDEDRERLSQDRECGRWQKRQWGRRLERLGTGTTVKDEAARCLRGGVYLTGIRSIFRRFRSHSLTFLPILAQEGRLLAFQAIRYKLHYYETPGIKVVMNTNLGMGPIRDVLHHIPSGQCQSHSDPCSQSLNSHGLEPQTPSLP